MKIFINYTSKNTAEIVYRLESISFSFHFRSMFHFLPPTPPENIRKREVFCFHGEHWSEMGSMPVSATAHKVV